MLSWLCACLIALSLLVVSCSGDAGAGSCPATMPTGGAACSVTTPCTYGHTTCCGRTYTDYTCQCQEGTFFCVRNEECNVVCLDAGGG